MITRITQIDQSLHDKLAVLGDSFYNEARLPGKFILSRALLSWGAILAANLGALWIYESNGKVVGMIGAMIGQDLNDGEVTVQETFWYVTPGNRGLLGGIRLFEEMMAWAKSIGARRVIMAHLLTSMPQKLKNFYEHEGFVAAEVNYVKEL